MAVCFLPANVCSDNNSRPPDNVCLPTHYDANKVQRIRRQRLHYFFAQNVLRSMLHSRMCVCVCARAKQSRKC